MDPVEKLSEILFSVDMNNPIQPASHFVNKEGWHQKERPIEERNIPQKDLSQGTEGFFTPTAMSETHSIADSHADQKRGTRQTTARATSQQPLIRKQRVRSHIMRAHQPSNWRNLVWKRLQSLGIHCQQLGRLPLPWLPRKRRVLVLQMYMLL